MVIFNAPFASGIVLLNLLTLIQTRHSGVKVLVTGNAPLG